LCRFRNGLVKHNLFDSLLRVVNQSLEVNGFTFAQGKYISSDATLIASARRPKRVLQGQKTASGHYAMADVVYSDDRAAAWIKQGSQPVYGYSASVTTDEVGLIESMSPLPANGRAMTRLEAVLSCTPRVPGQTLVYDNGVDSAANRQHLKARGLKDSIMRKEPKDQAMADWERIQNKLISQRRFVTERTFGTLKRSYGLYRACYVGLVKTQAEVMTKAIAYTLRRGLNNALRAIETG
jgi:IS5 family transposase